MESIERKKEEYSEYERGFRDGSEHASRWFSQRDNNQLQSGSFHNDNPVGPEVHHDSVNGPRAELVPGSEVVTRQRYKIRDSLGHYYVLDVEEISS